MKISEIQVGDVFPDLRVTVATPPESLSDHLQVLDCFIEGTNGQTVTLILPKDHEVNVYRL